MDIFHRLHIVIQYETEMTPQGPQQQIVKPLQALTPIAIPGNFSFAIACSIAGFDTSKENSVKIMFLDPSNNVLYDTGDVNFQLPTEPNQAKWNS
ncbi:MAG: hypothetical protein ACLUTU_16205 [Blautia faecis]